MNSKRDRTNSLRFNKRPTSAQQHGRGSPSGGPNGRTYSVSTQQRQQRSAEVGVVGGSVAGNVTVGLVPGTGTVPGAGGIGLRQLDFVRSLDSDSE